MRIIENSKKPAIGGGSTKCRRPRSSRSSSMPRSASASRVPRASASVSFQLRAAARAVNGRIGSSATRAASRSLNSTCRIR